MDASFFSFNETNEPGNYELLDFIKRVTPSLQ